MFIGMGPIALPIIIGTVNAKENIKLNKQSINSLGL